MAKGTIIINSEPQGADVMVNGIVKGVTPITLSKLDGGQYHIYLKKEGYHIYHKEQFIDFNDPSIIITINAILIPSSQPAEYKCLVCGQIFDEQAKLDLHYDTEHMTAEAPEYTPPPPQIKSKTNYTPYIIGGVAIIGLGLLLWALSRKKKAV